MRARGLSLFLGGEMLLAFEGVALASEAGGGHLNWWDFTLRSVNFVILVLILGKLLKKPISNFFTSRRENIKLLLAELSEKQALADAKAAEYRSRLSLLEDETRKIVSELITEGEAERQRILEGANRQAEYVRQQAQLAIQQEIKAARESLQEEVANLSVSAAEDLLRKNIKSEDQDRLIKDFMMRVVEAK